MLNIQQLIEQVCSLITCPECGRGFESKEISCKGYMEHTYVLQTKCSNQHATVFTTWITSYVNPETDRLTPIDSDHVLDLHKALKRFNGDFKRLWSKKGT
jgi:hypothetical protein